MAKRSASTTPSDGAAWARTVRPRLSQVNRFAKFAERCPDAGRFVREVVDVRRAGECEASLPQLMDELARRFCDGKDAPFSCESLHKWVRAECDYEWTRRV